MQKKINPITGDFNIVGYTPQYNTDPSSIKAGDTWVLAEVSGGSGGGKLYGLFGAMPLVTRNAGGSATYRLSYKTKEGDIKRFELTSNGEMPFKRVSSNYAISQSDYTIECANALTITLPTAIGLSGKVFNIKNTSASDVTVDTVLSQTIDGESTETIAQYENLTVQSNNVNWIIL